MTPAPLCILSTPHGEAMRLAAMLGQHPNAVAFPEMGLFHAERISTLMTLFARGDHHAADGLLRAVARFIFQAEDDRAITHAQRWLERRADWRSSSVLDALLDAVAPQVAVIPECAAPMRIRELDRCLAAAPDAHWLHLTRHPLHFRAATMARIEGQLNVTPDYKDHSGSYPRLEPLLLWYRVHDTLLRTLDDDARQQAAVRRLHRLQLEQLHANPSATLRELTEAVGWSTKMSDIAAMLHPEYSPWARSGPRTATAGVDPDFVSTPSWQVPLAERSAPPADVVATLPEDILHLADQLGYPRPASGTVSPRRQPLSAAT